tara:strand:+ start:283 stop:897 length:615 start_codon:yes stop_codon:yes gene_type:complete
MRLFCYILILPIFIFAQNFKSGLIGGISISQVSGDNLSGFNKIGPRIGLFVNRNINWYSFQLELHYQTKGSRETINYSEQHNFTDNLNYNFLSDYNFQLDYIGVPLLFSLDFTNKIKVEFGNAINILINQKEKIDYYLDNSRKVNRLEYAFLIGLVYKLNNKYSINIRFSNSILPIRKHSSGEVYRLNRGQYNSSLNFNILYNF